MMSSSLSAHNQARFASGGLLVAEALKALLAPPPVNVADYAAGHRWLANEGGGYVGRWNHAEAPYLMAPMDELGNLEIRTIAVVGPGQSGKSEIARNWVFASAEADPADFLWYSSSEPLVTSEVKTHFVRMEDNHLSLRQKLRGASLSYRRYGPMKVEFLPGIMSNFTSKSAPRIVADEFDAIAKAIPSALELLNVRRQTFGTRSKVLALCHPDLAPSTEEKDWNAGIMEIYRKSDQRKWYWPCPECGAWSSPNPTAVRVMTLHYDVNASDDDILENARLLCPVNGCLIEDGQRKAMNLEGKWIGAGQQIEQDGTVTGELIKRDTAGFWITGLMSPFMIGGIGGLAVSLANAERKYLIDGDRKAMAEVFSKRAGVPLTKDRKAQTIDANVVAERCESMMMGEVQNGVRFITAFADVQRNRFEVLVRGWGEKGESWVIDYQKIEADTAVSPIDWDRLIAFMAETVWPLADGSGRGMKARLVGFDSGGEAGVTMQAYDAWRRARTGRKLRRLGKIDGRDCWSVIPTKGASGANAPRLQVIYPDTQRSDKYAGARGDIPLAMFAPNSFKDDLMAQLNRAEAGPWAVHFPKALRKEAAPGQATPVQPFFVGMVEAENRMPNGKWVRATPKIPNEPMDLMVGNHALAHLTGLTRISWASPPPWAQEWETNSNVMTLTPAAQGSQPEVVHDRAPVSAVGPAPTIKGPVFYPAPQAAALQPAAATANGVQPRRSLVNKLA